eukprot:scaffold5360_cov118-Isochrysis_galbana.AAC.2
MARRKCRRAVRRVRFRSRVGRPALPSASRGNASRSSARSARSFRGTCRGRRGRAPGGRRATGLPRSTRWRRAVGRTRTGSGARTRRGRDAGGGGGLAPGTPDSRRGGGGGGGGVGEWAHHLPHLTARGDGCSGAARGAVSVCGGWKTRELRCCALHSSGGGVIDPFLWLRGGGEEESEALTLTTRRGRPSTHRWKRKTVAAAANSGGVAPEGASASALRLAGRGGPLSQTVKTRHRSSAGSIGEWASISKHISDCSRWLRDASAGNDVREPQRTSHE